MNKIRMDGIDDSSLRAILLKQIPLPPAWNEYKDPEAKAKKSVFFNSITKQVSEEHPAKKYLEKLKADPSLKVREH